MSAIVGKYNFDGSPVSSATLLPMQQAMAHWGPDGVGALRYLQLRQLHQVYRTLRSADPETESVSNVLCRHGVWEWGRFARRYRLTFGELPSQTLQRGKRDHTPNHTVVNQTTSADAAS